MLRSPTATDQETTGAHLIHATGQAAGQLKLELARRAGALLRILQSYLPDHAARHPPGSTWPPQS